MDLLNGKSFRLFLFIMDYFKLLRQNVKKPTHLSKRVGDVVPGVVVYPSHPTVEMLGDISCIKLL